MSFLTRLAIMFYLTVISMIGSLTMLFVSRQIGLNDVIDILSFIYNDFNAGIVVCAVAGAIILMSFLFAKIIFNRQYKERTIAFENPSGQVTVSLSAMEDLIRRLIERDSEIKETRVAITAHKRGLEVEIKLILQAEVQIPEMTSKIQDMVKAKLQDVIGLEEKITIRVHVMKFVAAYQKSRKQKIETPPQPNIPFQGYRA